MKDEKCLVLYKFDKLDPKDRVRITRELFGYKEQSHKGKYQYQTKGRLYNYEKPVRSVIILQRSDVDDTLKILKKYNAKTRAYLIQKLLR